MTKIENTMERLAELARNAPHVRSNLYNAGLTMAGCEVAYSAALFAGANSEQAFEAARQHMLVNMLPRAINTHTQRQYQSGFREYTVQDRANRLAQMDAVRALPNPFSPVSALERAA